MTPRIDVLKTHPAAFQAMLAMQSHVNASGIDPGVFDLIKLRASQINGCAYCIDMHAIDARAAGETEQRLYALDAWREAADLVPSGSATWFRAAAASSIGRSGS